MPGYRVYADAIAKDALEEELPVGRTDLPTGRAVVVLVLVPWSRCAGCFGGVTRPFLPLLGSEVPGNVSHISSGPRTVMIVVLCAWIVSRYWTFNIPSGTYRKNSFGCHGSAFVKIKTSTLTLTNPLTLTLSSAITG